MNLHIYKFRPILHSNTKQYGFTLWNFNFIKTFEDFKDEIRNIWSHEETTQSRKSSKPWTQSRKSFWLLWKKKQNTKTHCYIYMNALITSSGYTDLIESLCNVEKTCVVISVILSGDTYIFPSSLCLILSHSWHTSIHCFFKSRLIKRFLSLLFLPVVSCQ